MGPDMKTRQKVFLNNVSAKQIRHVSGKNGKELYSVAVMIPVPKTEEEKAQPQSEKDALAKEIGFYPKNGSILKHDGQIFVKCNCGYCDRQSIQIFDKDTDFAETCEGCGAPYDLELMPNYEPPKGNKPVATQYGNVWASVLVEPRHVFPVRNLDGSMRDGYFNVSLGAESDAHLVQIKTKDCETNECTYTKKQMNSAEIAEEYNAVRKAYHDSTHVKKSSQRGGEFDGMNAVSNEDYQSSL